MRCIYIVLGIFRRVLISIFKKIPCTHLWRIFQIVGHCQKLRFETFLIYKKFLPNFGYRSSICTCLMSINFKQHDGGKLICFRLFRIEQKKVLWTGWSLDVQSEGLGKALEISRQEGSQQERELNPPSSRDIKWFSLKAIQSWTADCGIGLPSKSCTAWLCGTRHISTELAGQRITWITTVTSRLSLAQIITNSFGLLRVRWHSGSWMREKRSRLHVINSIKPT